MSEIIEKNKHYLVQSTCGTFSFNNRKTAEQLHEVLTNYEIIAKQAHTTNETLDRITRKVIQLQMNLKITQEDLDKLKKELNI